MGNWELFANSDDVLTVQIVIVIPLCSILISLECTVFPEKVARDQCVNCFSSSFLLTSSIREVTLDKQKSGLPFHWFLTLIFQSAVTNYGNQFSPVKPGRLKSGHLKIHVSTVLICEKVWPPQGAGSSSLEMWKSIALIHISYIKEDVKYLVLWDNNCYLQQKSYII